MLNNEIPELDTNGLRQFGLMLGVFVIAVFGILLPWMWDSVVFPNLHWIIIGVVVMIWSLVASDSIRGLYRVWMYVALKIGQVVNSVVLALVYFVGITPMGVAMRLMGKDPMCRILDKSVKTYRVISKVPSKNHVERPF